MHIDASKTMVIIPSHDGNLVANLAGSLVACASQFSGLAFVLNNSDVALARNLQVQMFLDRSEFDWLIFIDADIQFTPQDFQYCARAMTW